MKNLQILGEWGKTSGDQAEEFLFHCYHLRGKLHQVMLTPLQGMYGEHIANVYQEEPKSLKELQILGEWGKTSGGIVSLS